MAGCPTVNVAPGMLDAGNALRTVGGPVCHIAVRLDPTALLVHVFVAALVAEFLPATVPALTLPLPPDHHRFLASVDDRVFTALWITRDLNITRLMGNDE